MIPRELKPGEVVQIGDRCPEKELRGCFMVVTGPLSIGAEGVVRDPRIAAGKDGEYLGVFTHFDYIEPIGWAEWAPDSVDEVPAR